TSDEIIFNNPQSVSFDSMGNIYIVDDDGVRIATSVNGRLQVVSLAQLGSFGKAVSVVVQGTQIFVLDADPKNVGGEVIAVTVGAPVITSLSIDNDKLEGGSQLIIIGKNFAPESIVTLGDKTVADAMVESATQIRLTVPQQDAPGTR